ncbi:DUF2332 domain-containing protein [Fimbriimonas ginsengisoli]|uniref:DUF2332 domain-containing protein n=1 Tax=Fimbriimonas ginsengisoli Gsoil 348 TaxID=661478 RepID=A0A068NN72_FIMGI|nr:DUF2332 domain-containing protein [Fimbriimonas ginsengisoli]AIE84190.1 hypothetical protein OP10G_0822 [Fimbriimonas ginsengisoli Gsoil 348]
MPHEILAEKFREFARSEAAHSSPIYAGLALRVADSPELLELVAEGPSNQPFANLLFSSVRVVLAEEGRDIDAGDTAEVAFEKVVDIARRRRTELLHLMNTRIVQTNEVRRSIYLYCAFLRLSEEIGRRPVALIEIGASAGLNLVFEQHRYQFEGRTEFGNAKGRLCLTSVLRGSINPPAGNSGSPIFRRYGLDLNPLDMNSEADAAWLRALIWPDHTERITLLTEAILVQREFDIEMRKGDGIELLPSVIQEIPSDVVPYVFHTHVANQLSSEQKGKLLAAIERLGRDRDVIHVFNNIHPHLHATVVSGGRQREIPLARTEGHGRWVEWLDQGDP